MSGGGNPEAGVGKLIAKAKLELEHMIDMNPQIMLLVAVDGTILRTNRALLGMLGRTTFENVLGAPIGELFATGDGAFFKRLLTSIDGIREGEAAVELPNRGSHVLRFSVIGSSDGGSERVVIVEDITENKRRDAELKQIHRKEAIRELVGALMHAINQHLTVISVRTKLLSMAIDKGNPDPEQLQKGLADISDLTMRIADTLGKVGQPRDFTTTPYLLGTDILDLDTPLPQDEPKAESLKATPETS